MGLGWGGHHQRVPSIAEWLEDQGLDQYENNFRVNGFDNLDFLVSLDQQHVEWLEDQGLDQYENNFRVNGFDHLDFLVSFKYVLGCKCNQYPQTHSLLVFGLSHLAIKSVWH